LFAENEGRIHQDFTHDPFQAPRGERGTSARATPPASWSNKVKFGSLKNHVKPRKMYGKGKKPESF